MACGDDTDSNTNTVLENESEPITDFSIINGLWWNSDIIKSDGNGTMGVWMFHYPHFWSLNSWGYAWKGAYMVEGAVDAEGEASGNFEIAVTNKKDGSTGYHWRENEDPPPAPRDFLFKELDGEAVLIIDSKIFTRTTWESHEALYYNENSWQGMIGEKDLDDLIIEITPPLTGRPVANTVINGLWWKEDLINNGDSSGNPGVWVFDFPNFWRLDSEGAVQKGTFTVNGELVDEEGSSAGAFTAVSTGKKDSTTGNVWVSASSTVTIDWELNADGITLTINPDMEYAKIKWHSSANKPVNKGPWQNTIDDPILNDLIPPLYGWDDVNNVFVLPPFFAPQPAETRDAINANDASYTRDLLTPFTTSVTVPPAILSSSLNNRMISIRTNGVDGADGNNHLNAALLRQAKFIVFKLEDSFDGVFNNRDFYLGLYAPSLIPRSDTLWSNSSNMEAYGSEKYFLRQSGVWNAARGCYYDNVHKLVAIGLPMALPLYDTPMFQNAAMTSSMKIIIGISSGSSALLYEDMPITGLYLVNIVD